MVSNSLENHDPVKHEEGFTFFWIAECMGDRQRTSIKMTTQFDLGISQNQVLEELTAKMGYQWGKALILFLSTKIK